MGDLEDTPDPVRQFRCKGCGEIDSIVDVSAMPWVKGVMPGDTADIEWKSYPDDLDAYEAAPSLGYACYNENCEFWHGSVGVMGDFASGTLHIALGKKLNEIAEVVKPAQAMVERYVEITEWVLADG